MDAITILNNLIPADLDAGTVFSGSSSGKKVKGYAEATPFTPAVDTNYIFHEQVRDVAVWFIDRFDPLYVYGPPSVGKTSVIKQLAARLHYPVFEITGHNRLEFQDMIGHHTVQNGNMTFQYGPLALAMKFGGLFLLNEIDLLEPSTAAGLNGILDGQTLCIPEAGTMDADITAAFGQIDAAAANGLNNTKEFWMLRKQILTQGARRKFGLGRDPFSDDFSDPEDVFLSRDGRYVLESMHQTARHGGMTALIGESGSGKTTLRRALIDRLEREDARVIVIEPYTLGMDNGNKSVPSLRASHICEAILAAIDPSYKGTTASPEARFRHMHKRLKESARAGFRHLVILEEAHSLPLYTIKHLKRFFELTDGLTRLMSFLLIGQPELKTKLAETNAEVREIVQRMEVVELYPLEETEAYVRHRLERAGGKFDDIFAPDAMPELSLRLTGPAPRGKSGGQSLLFPLLIGNMLTKALNLASELKMPKVDAGIIQQA